MRVSSILVVEDNADDELMTLEAIRSSGLEGAVVVARDGEEALKMLFGSLVQGLQPGSRPSAVLLDLKLPKVDGLQVLSRIRSDSGLRDLPVAILTSSDEERDLVEGYRLAVACYIRKPVQIGELTEAFRQLGIYWTANQPRPGTRS